MIMVEPNPTIQNAKDKIAEAERMMAEARKMLADAEAEAKRNITDDPVAEYKEAAENRTYVYIVDYMGRAKSSITNRRFCPEDYNPYYRYMDKFYADEAARLKQSIDEQLAFKWCNN